MTFTKEQLIEKLKHRISVASEFPESEKAQMDLELARIALASLEAEPAACQHQWRFGGANKLQRQQQCVKCGRVELVAPPAPVVDCVPLGDSPYDVPYSMPSNLRELIAEEIGILFSDDDAQSVWNVCRSAAMLQGAEPVTTAYKLPIQPLVIDAHGTLRFKENPIVRALLDYATEHGYGLNEIALEEFDAEDQMQLAQLIGYSLSGYGTLSYVTDESYERAAAAAPQQEVKP